MYQAGDKVVYGMHGVCEVVDLENHVVDSKQLVYLVLEPLGQSGSRYLVPTHNAAAMGKVRAVLGRGELETLIHSEEVRHDVWISDEGQRKQYYRELITSGDRRRLMQMVCSLYRYRRLQAAAGKKFHMCDANFLQDAEKLLCSELSITLGLSPNEARDYLRTNLKEDA